MRQWQAVNGGKDRAQRARAPRRWWVTWTAVVAGAVSLAIASIAAGTPAASAASMQTYCANQNALFRDAHPFVGAVDPLTDYDSAQMRNCSFGRMSADHVGYFRETFWWSLIESSPQHYNFSGYDGIVAAVAKHHMHLLPVLLGAPSWLSTRPAKGAKDETYPPRNAGQFAAFAKLVVQRYGPGGSFWRQNPTLPYFPVRAWEIWNEPNLPLFWAPKPNPAAYVRLLKAASTAIKRVDRHATIVLAGMPFFNGPAESAFLTQLYRDGARGSFDALGLHAYSVTVSGALARLQTARAVMNRHGDRRKGIWLTEWGWAGGPPNPYIVSAKGQRANVSAFLGLLQRYRRSLGLSEAFYFYWRDGPPGPGPRNYWAWHLGLIAQNLTPKLVLSAFTAAARNLDR